MKKLLLLSILIFSIQYKVSAQDINPDPYNNRVLLSKYTYAELVQLENSHFEKFKHLKYYYIHSFHIDENTLSSCPEFDPQLFDVSQYESYRTKTEDVTFFLPCGVKIILISGRKLETLVSTDGNLPIPDEKETER